MPNKNCVAACRRVADLPVEFQDVPIMDSSRG
jgi:hypothetical protein